MSVRAIFRCSVLFTLLGVALWANAAPLWAADALPATPPATPPVVDSTLPTDTQENAATPDGEGERPPDATPRFGFALKPTYMLMAHSDDYHHIVGMAFQFDYNVLSKWLDISLGFGVLAGGSISLFIPVDLVLHVRLVDSKTIWPYVGLGMKALFIRVMTSDRNLIGGIVAAGAKWRIGSESGLQLEVRYLPLHDLEGDAFSGYNISHMETSIGYWWRF